jgi:hypothetical protein
VSAFEAGDVVLALANGVDEAEEEGAKACQ